MTDRRIWLLLGVTVILSIVLWVQFTAVDRDAIRQQAESGAAYSAESVAQVASRVVTGLDGTIDSRDPAVGNQTTDEHLLPEDSEQTAANRETDAVDADSVVTSPDGTESDESEAGEQQTLSGPVYDVINEVQARFTAQQWQEGLNELNALYENFDQLNAFEQAIVLNFYTNALLALEMYDEAIFAFEDVLTVPDLRSDMASRAMLALAQLHARQQDHERSASYLADWLSLEGNSNPDAPNADAVLLLLANAHYHLEQYPSAIAFLEDHIGVRMHMGQPVQRQSYELLSQLHTQMGNLEDSQAVQRILDDLDN